VGITVILDSGDFVYDTKSGDIGFLVSRHVSGTPSSSTGFMLLVWRIYWCREGDTRYTEESIINMVRNGHLLLYTNN
jgi:hypothetical protein